MGGAFLGMGERWHRLLIVNDEFHTTMISQCTSSHRVQWNHSDTDLRVNVEFYNAVISQCTTVVPITCNEVRLLLLVYMTIPLTTLCLHQSPNLGWIETLKYTTGRPVWVDLARNFRTSWETYVSPFEKKRIQPLHHVYPTWTYPHGHQFPTEGGNLLRDHLFLQAKQLTTAFEFPRRPTTSHHTLNTRTGLIHSITEVLSTETPASMPIAIPKKTKTTLRPGLFSPLPLKTKKTRSPRIVSF